MHRAVAKKKILAQEMGQKKKLWQAKNPPPPPPPITFLMVRPLQFFFLLSKLCKFWQHWFANFCFCEREPELPRFLISYHNSSRAKLYHSVYLNSILYIPRPILSL